MRGFLRSAQRKMALSTLKVKRQAVEEISLTLVIRTLKKGVWHDRQFPDGCQNGCLD